MKQDRLDAAFDVLRDATNAGQIEAASMYVRHRDSVRSRSFGAAHSEDSIFLLASISKPISIAAVMTLYDQKLFALDDGVQKFLPEFSGELRGRVTMRDLMTHRSGLPDQLPENTTTARSPRGTRRVRRGSRDHSPALHAGIAIQLLQHGNLAGWRSGAANRWQIDRDASGRSRVDAARDDTFGASAWVI